MPRAVPPHACPPAHTHTHHECPQVTIPKEGATIVFAPSGIKTPQRAQPAQAGKPAVAGEPYADEAVAFTREHALQRDCEITIETMDKGGTFLGNINIFPVRSPIAPPGCTSPPPRLALCSAPVLTLRPRNEAVAQRSSGRAAEAHGSERWVCAC